MAYSRNLLDAELIRDEGLMVRAYRDTLGTWTIGVGRNLDAVGIRPAENRQFGITVQSCLSYGITKAEALAMLDNDVADCETALDVRFPWWRTLDDVRQRVLLNMCFQLGIQGLAKFKATLAAIQTAAWATAAASMRNSLWAHQTPSRAARLAHMMETGSVLA